MSSNKNNKATESQKKLLMVLLMAVVFFAAYRFGYQPLTQETEQLEEENAALEREIADLKNKAQNEEIYQRETEAIHGQIGEILKKFGPGVTPEKSILFFIQLAQAAQVQIPTISFGEPAVVYTTSSLTNVEGIPYNQYAATYSVAYSTTYEGLKTLIAYINLFPEKMNLNTLTVAYNSETDSLSGNFSIDWYMLTGTDKQYNFKDLEVIDIGNENIFRSGAGNGEGFDFNFDFDFGIFGGNAGESGSLGDAEEDAGAAGSDADANANEDAEGAEDAGTVDGGSDADADAEDAEGAGTADDGSDADANAGDAGDAEGAGTAGDGSDADAEGAGTADDGTDAGTGDN